MKRSALLALAMLIFPNFVHAADPLKVAPDMYKLLYENEQVRVMKVTFAPGQKIAEHSHPNHYVVVESPGKLKISKPNGTSSEVNLKQDEVIWIAAESHWAENTGTTPVTLIVNELKTNGSAHN